MKRPPYPLCWECNGAFLDGRFAIVDTEGGRVYVHKDCADEMRHEGRGLIRVRDGERLAS